MRGSNSKGHRAPIGRRVTGGLHEAGGRGWGRGGRGSSAQGRQGASCRAPDPEAGAVA